MAIHPHPIGPLDGLLLQAASAALATTCTPHHSPHLRDPESRPDLSDSSIHILMLHPGVEMSHTQLCQTVPVWQYYGSPHTVRHAQCVINSAVISQTTVLVQVGYQPSNVARASDVPSSFHRPHLQRLQLCLSDQKVLNVLTFCCSRAIFLEIASLFAWYARTRTSPGDWSSRISETE